MFSNLASLTVIKTRFSSSYHHHYHLWKFGRGLSISRWTLLDLLMQSVDLVHSLLNGLIFFYLKFMLKILLLYSENVPQIPSWFITGIIHNNPAKSDQTCWENYITFPPCPAMSDQTYWELIYIFRLVFLPYSRNILIRQKFLPFPAIFWSDMAGMLHNNPRVSDQTRS